MEIDNRPLSPLPKHLCRRALPEVQGEEGVELIELLASAALLLQQLVNLESLLDLSSL